MSDKSGREQTFKLKRREFLSAAAVPLAAALAPAALAQQSSGSRARRRPDTRWHHRRRRHRQLGARSGPQAATGRRARRRREPLARVEPARRGRARHCECLRQLGRAARGRRSRRRADRHLALHAPHDDAGRARRGLARALSGAHGEQHRRSARDAGCVASTIRISSASSCRPRAAIASIARCSACSANAMSATCCRSRCRCCNAASRASTASSTGATIPSSAASTCSTSAARMSPRCAGSALATTSWQRPESTCRRGATSKVGPRTATIPDHVEVLYELANGAPVHMKFSETTGLSRGNQIWIFGSEGTIYVDNEQKIFGGRPRRSGAHGAAEPARATGRFIASRKNSSTRSAAASRSR